MITLIIFIAILAIAGVVLSARANRKADNAEKISKGALKKTFEIYKENNQLKK